MSYGETVTRLRAATGTDPYSGEAAELDWDAATAVNLSGFAVAPGAFTETNTPDRTRVDILFTVYGPYAADVEPLDRLIVRGITCEVVGKRQDWRNPYTRNDAGCVVEVRKVAG